MAQNCAHPTVFGCRGEYLGALTGGGGSHRRTRLCSRFPCFAGKYREIRRIWTEDDDWRSSSQWKFNRLQAEFPKHQIRELVHLKQGT